MRRGRRPAADILHLCWEKASETPQELVTEELIDRAFGEGKELVLWHEERPDVLKDIMALARCSASAPTCRT
jgi:hypothetical protein